jgi:FKBP-type peptidyl-prolyl cis-trans isomerase FklB
MIKKKLWFMVFLGAAGCVGAADAPQLGTDEQKASYAMGVQITQNMVQQGLKIDPDAFSLAIKDVLSGQKPRLSAEELQAALTKQQEKMMQERQASAQKNKTASETFLAENKKKDGIQVLPSGVQYRVIAEGKGNKPKSTDTVIVHYRGTLTNGKEFDSSYGREPATFPVNGVIQGWQEVLPMMQEGAKWQVFTPPDQAYGERGAGGAIGPNETLIFDIELVAVNPPAK